MLRLPHLVLCRDGSTALTLAVCAHHVSIVLVLLKNGALVNVVCRSRETALMLAISEMWMASADPSVNDSIVRLLLEYQANTNSIDK
jgi:hypothetical protein